MLYRVFNLLLSADSSTERVQSLLNFCGLHCGCWLLTSAIVHVYSNIMAAALLTYTCHRYTQWQVHKYTHAHPCGCCAHTRTHLTLLNMAMFIHTKHTHLKWLCALKFAVGGTYIACLSLSLSLSLSPSPSPSPSLPSPLSPPSPQQAQAEQEEEFISNTLLKKIHSLKKEKEALAMNYEQEEEFLTNDLSRKLAQVCPTTLSKKKNHFV